MSGSRPGWPAGTRPAAAAIDNPPCINCPTNSLVASTNMWAKIDGHLLLYAFLPALLFGDSMNLDVYNFQRNFSQCLVLACPGVLEPGYWPLPLIN